MNFNGSRHAGAVAIVTGAASGIGRTTATQLAREGSMVVACDINEGGLESLASEGVVAQIVCVDLAQPGEVDRVVQAAQSLGPVTHLANIAGIMDHFLPAHETDDATWARVMSVNVDAAFRLSRAVLPTMRVQGSGAIVNMGSVAGARGGTAGVAYTTSKHALVGMTRSIAWAYAADGIRCNIVMPGYVETGISTSGDPRSTWGLERAKPVLAQSVRRSQPEDIAGVVSWLLSDESSTVNGALISADSGWSAG